ncbi:hypothetical protein MMPV_007097 [Pyropia vietnamensis]
MASVNAKKTVQLDPLGTGDKADVMEITPLGAGGEVGRSCCVLRFRGKMIMFDCGVHPAYSGLASLPFFDPVDLDEVDVLLATHFHLDHAAALPYLMEKTNFNPKARVFMTHPTKAIYKTLMSDFVRVSHHSADDNLYSEADVLRTMPRIESIDYHQEVSVDGIRFWAYNAGHVLGAAMFMVEIAGVRVLYTGDFSREEDRHLKSAEVPPTRPDVLIVESTYGVQVHEPRRVREARFTQRVASVVRRGGRVLMPVFALGRAQELLLILDEFWEANPDIQDVPIYYASALAKRCMSVYQTYINMMNDAVRRRYDVGNPFAFKYVSSLRSIEDLDDRNPCVVMASPGMLQSGLSRALFERWCPDKRSGLILSGYSVEGTLAKHVLTEPQSITRMDGKEVPLRCSVDYITFSAHSDFLQTSSFIDACQPGNIVLVHGSSEEMSRLRMALDQRYNRGPPERRIALFTPKNSHTVALAFRGATIAKAIGVLPKHAPAEGTRVRGVMVRKDFTHTLMAPDDLQRYTRLGLSHIRQRLVLPLAVPMGELARELAKLFENVVVSSCSSHSNGGVGSLGRSGGSGGGGGGDGGEQKLTSALGGTSPPGPPVVSRIVVVSAVTLVEERDTGGHKVVMSWQADNSTDMVADAIAALVLRAAVAGGIGVGGGRPAGAPAPLAVEAPNTPIPGSSSGPVAPPAPTATSEPPTVAGVKRTVDGTLVSALAPNVKASTPAESTAGSGQALVKAEPQPVLDPPLPPGVTADASVPAVASAAGPVTSAAALAARPTVPSAHGHAGAPHLLDDDFVDAALAVTRRLLSARFGPIQLSRRRPTVSRLVVDLHAVTVDHATGGVACVSLVVRERVRLALHRIQAAVLPIPDYYCPCCADCIPVDEADGGRGRAPPKVEAGVKREPPPPGGVMNGAGDSDAMAIGAGHRS